MKFKRGVNLSGLKPVMRPALIIIDKIYKKYKIEAIITETNKKLHSAGSLHYYGLAIDVRNYWWNPILKSKALKAFVDIRKELSKYYDIIMENDHMHIELKDYISFFKNPGEITAKINKELAK